METNSFKIVMPASLEKSGDDWIVQGLASTNGIDQQGEKILPAGIDASPIDSKKGILNWDHLKGPENTLGVLDSYKKDKKGFWVKGRLFKNHTKAKAVREIMESLSDDDRGRMGLSVEGKILERGGADGKTIKKCQINAVALTMNPVNASTFVDLVKSFSEDSTEIDFNATENQPTHESTSQTPVFTAQQVVDLLGKALSAGDPSSKAPPDRTGGEALAQENLDRKKKRKPKKMTKELYKSSILQILEKLQVLHPEFSRQELFEAVKDRLNTRFITD